MIERLLDYRYPGNIRELRNILQVAAAQLGNAHRGVITGEVIAKGLRMRDSFRAAGPVGQGAGSVTGMSSVPPASQGVSNTAANGAVAASSLQALEAGIASPGC